MDESALRLWRTLRWPMFGLVLVIAYGTLGYVFIEGLGVLDALYMTSLVLSTVGLREVGALGPAGKAFTISLIVLGASLALVTISLTARWLVEADWPSRNRRRRMERRLQRISDHVVVCAYGRVGRAVVDELRSEGVPVVVIEIDPALEGDLTREGFPHIVDDPSSEEVLRRAGVDRARGLISAVDSDATNVYITLTARTINPDLFIIARASEDAALKRLRRAGANRVISPYSASGRQMAALIT